MSRTPFGHPLYVMLKPVGARCNLSCKYCYYLEKEHLSDNASQSMDDLLLERFVRQYIEAQTLPQVLFTWHGGEPLLKPLSFYQRAMELQRRYAKGRLIDNCLQTNGTLLTDEWCRFFHDNGWLVGISIDGPQWMHDAYRCNRHGMATHAQVMHGIELLERHGVEWNAMAVVSNLTTEHPLEFYHFFKQIECHYLQFTPIVERICQHADGRTLAHVGQEGEFPLTPQSVTPDGWGNFLCTLFDEWVRKDVGTIFVQMFDATLANWVGEAPGICALSPTCGHAAVMEADGNVYACDHFVFPEYKLGNIHTHTLVEMLYSDRQRLFGQGKTMNLPNQCLQCMWRFACHGECPRNRFALTPDGTPGLNYLCAGYHRFFSHCAPCMDYMKWQLDQGLPPSNVMQWMDTP